MRLASGPVTACARCGGAIGPLNITSDNGVYHASCFGARGFSEPPVRDEPERRAFRRTTRGQKDEILICALAQERG